MAAITLVPNKNDCCGGKSRAKGRSIVKGSTIYMWWDCARHARPYRDYLRLWFAAIVLALLLWDPSLPPMTLHIDCVPAKVVQFRGIPQRPDGTGIYYTEDHGAECHDRWEWT